MTTVVLPSSALVTPASPLSAEAQEPERRKWTVAEFERAIDLGLFGREERLELIDGEIVHKVTQNAPHTTGMRKCERAMNRIFGEGFDVRTQSPLNFGDSAGDRPEPDVAVVTGTIEDYATYHPTTAALVIEVSDTTLRYDRTMKAGQYARAGIPEVWILNLVDRVLEVYRHPAPMSGQLLGHYYGNITRHTEADSVAPLAAPNSPVRVADLLP